MKVKDLILQLLVLPQDFDVTVWDVNEEEWRSIDDYPELLADEVAIHVRKDD